MNKNENLNPSSEEWVINYLTITQVAKLLDSDIQDIARLLNTGCFPDYSIFVLNGNIVFNERIIIEFNEDLRC